MFRGELLFCENCGKNHYITIGGGLYFEEYSSSTVHQMKQGKFGEEYKKLVNENNNIYVDCLRRVYYCDKCENWEIKECLDVYFSDAHSIFTHALYTSPENFNLLKAYNHICGKCNNTMRMLNENEDNKLKCLSCHSELVSKGHGIDWD